MKIPRSEPTNDRLTTQAPVQRADVRGLTEGHRNVQDLAETNQQVAQVFENAQILSEKTQAKTNARQRLANLEQEAITDPNINPVKYSERITKIKEEASNGIGLPRAREEFGYEFDNMALLSSAKINATYMARQIETAQAALFSEMDALGKAYSSSERPELRESYILQRNDTLAQNVKAGVITAEAAEKIKINTDKLWANNLASNDIEKNPTFAISELEKGSEGIYADLDSKTRLEKLDEARKMMERKEKQNKIDIEKVQNDTFRNLMTRAMNGESILADARTEFAAGKLEYSKYEKLHEFLTSPEAIDPKTNLSSYEEIMDMIDNGKTPEEDIEAKILEKAANGKLDDTDAKSLLKRSEDRQNSRKDDAIKRAKAGLRAWADQVIGGTLTDETLTGEAKGKIEELLYKYDKRVYDENADGERLEEISEEIKEGYMKEKYPEVSNLEEVPDVIIDVKGSITKLFTSKKKKKSQYTVTRNTNAGVSKE